MEEGSLERVPYVVANLCVYKSNKHYNPKYMQK